ncbi:hypothetical protein CKO25_16295 [Thiocapsa imhoffii]|uniref:DUF1269 domain-containing protein n=1 Tax=Thiocapsa imhoffii TaxID=382777 RepID=A0A9X0WLB2_9GAMM|nr:hypothetical protein [Thiocapsa imhoffii]MBK1646177.1 hypothetical protein [Thiocapsa imhoffii]
MSEYHHYVAGFFAHRDDAERVFSRLAEQGLPRERMQIFASDALPPPSAVQERSDAVLKDVVVDGAIGTAVGTGLGALAGMALVATNVTLFIASPLLAPLMLLGWGASVGGVVGAVAGASGDAGNEERRFADLIRDAIASDQIVLVAQTESEQETAIAQTVIQAAVGVDQEISTA